MTTLSATKSASPIAGVSAEPSPTTPEAVPKADLKAIPEANPEADPEAVPEADPDADPSAVNVTVIPKDRAPPTGCTTAGPRLSQKITFSPDVSQKLTREMSFRPVLPRIFSMKWKSKGKDSSRTLKSEESWRESLNSNDGSESVASQCTENTQSSSAVRLGSVKNFLVKGVKCAKAFDRIVGRVSVDAFSVTKVRFRGEPLDDLDVMKLAFALRGSTYVVIIDLGNCSMTSDGAKYLFDTLRKNSTLKTLKLDGNRIGRKGARAAADALHFGRLSLTHLDIARNKIGPDGARDLSGFISNPRSCLEYLDLSDNGIGDAAINIATRMQSKLLLNTKLTTLKLSRNGIGSGGASALAAALRDNSTLQKLCLCQNPIEEEGGLAFVDALSCNHSLMEFSFNPESVGLEQAEEIHRLLRRNNDEAHHKEMRELASARKNRLERRRSS